MGSNRHAGSLVGGALLIVFGALALMGELFSGFQFWNWFWPFIIIGIGVMFYVGVLAGGKSTSGLAIPGTIITVIGLMFLFQQLTGYWESWTYGWTVILMAVGLGIYIMGAVNEDGNQRRAGLRVLWLGLIFFVVFGAFFSMILSDGMPYMNIFFPVALVLLGGYLIVVRSGLFSRSKPDQIDSTTGTPPGQPPVEGK
jgi:hypothetical protein